jgi:peptidoglycan/LPS O-acetylase OafA/YrhL
MRIKIQIGDRDPWHLSARPLIGFVLSSIGLLICAAGFILYHVPWWWGLLGAVIAVAAVICAVSMIHEKEDLNRAIADAEQKDAPR